MAQNKEIKKSVPGIGTQTLTTEGPRNKIAAVTLNDWQVIFEETTATTGTT